MRPLSDFDAQVVKAMPLLRLQARQLCKNRDTAEDMVQETLCRALTYKHQFTPGTKLNAWLGTILRHTFYATLRKNKRLVEDPDDKMTNTLLVCKEDHVERMDAHAMLRMIMALPSHHRDPLLLFADGASYLEIAEECMICEGTVKSRISRAREMLGVTQ